jgi:DNA-binding transcriptional MocR family regulator
MFFSSPDKNFYVGGLQGSNSLRINFSHSSKAEILKGIKILGALIRDLLEWYSGNQVIGFSYR